MGALCALALTILFSAFLAMLIEKGRVKEQNIGYGVMILLFLSSCIAAVVSARKIKHQYLLVCASSGAIYMGILLSITALFYGGQYEAVWETALVVFAGSLAAVLLSTGGSPFRRKKIGYHR